MKKSVSIILIIATFLGLFIGVLVYKPQKTKAFLGFGDITIDVVNQVKDWIVDALPRTIAKHMMTRLQQEITRWAQGGLRDDNQPLAMISWKQALNNALNIASARFVQELELTPLCYNFNFAIGTQLGLAQSYGMYPSYQVYAACTLETIIDNAEEFWENPSISVYGWDTWTALSQPQNNIYGSVLLAAKRKAELENEETEQIEKEVETGSGYMNEKECITTAGDACKSNCYTNAPGQTSTQLDLCLIGCEQMPTAETCIEYQTKNIGSSIHDAVEGAMDADIDWLITADEITEMGNLIFSGLLNKLINGLGLATTPFYQTSPTTVSENQAKYSYYSSYKSAQTSEDVANVKRDILQNILKAVKQISTSTYECDSDYQITGEVVQEIAAEILDEETQHLYTSIEGVNLKPDFVVLDSQQAVDNGLSVYGVTWDDIPFNRYPAECADISDTRCQEIITNLPYELELDNINSECTSGCLGRINTYRSDGIDDAAAISQAVADGACSSYEVGNACLQGAYLINRTENRCEECVSEAQLMCESISDSAQRIDCIENHCSNYNNISSSITSGQDFYNRCSAASLKESCNVCLKEYFIPAGYCEQIYDYINRSFVKYPAQVKEDIWWGSFNDFDTCANSRVSSSATIPVGLICRINPDFESAGRTCSTMCNVTEEQLKDITDNEPGDSDCASPASVNLGAYHPGGQYLEYLARKKAKCCAALAGNNLELYVKCREIGETTGEDEEPVISEICPEVAFNCPSWDWNGKDWNYNGVQDLGGLSNVSTNYRSRYFNQTIQPSASAASQLAEAEIIEIRANTGADIYLTEPYCWRPEQCCTNTSSYSACMSSIPDNSPCRLTQNEINRGYTNNKNAGVASGKVAGDLEPMWVPDPTFTSGGNWTAYGYCSTSPENQNDTSAFFGPNDVYAWNRAIHEDVTRHSNIVFGPWSDSNQSQSCSNDVSRSIDLSAYAGHEFWMTLQGASGGGAVCVPRT